MLEEGEHDLEFSYRKASEKKNTDSDTVTVTKIEDLKSQIADSLGYDKTQIILKDKYDCILIDDMDVFDLLFTYKKIIINGMNPKLKVTIPFG